MGRLLVIKHIQKLLSSTDNFLSLLNQMVQGFRMLRDNHGPCFLGIFHVYSEYIHRETALQTVILNVPYDRCTVSAMDCRGQRTTMELQGKVGMGRSTQHLNWKGLDGLKMNTHIIKYYNGWRMRIILPAPSEQSYHHPDSYSSLGHTTPRWLALSSTL